MMIDSPTIFWSLTPHICIPYLSYRSDASLHKHIEAPLQPSAGTKKPVLLYVQDCSTWKRDEEHWLLPAIIATCRAEQNENAVASSLLGHALGAYGDQEAIRPVDATYSRDPELDLPPGR